MKEGSIHSSDIGENVDEEDNGNIVSQSQTISKIQLQQIKTKLSTSIIQKSHNASNLEIPIEFRGTSASSPNESTLGSYIDMTNPPTLNLDLNDKTFELELELNELNAQLKEHLQMISKFEGYIQTCDKTITDLTNDIKKKEKDLSYRKALEEENNIKIAELTKQKNELITKLPKEKLTESKKNLPLKEYRELKFNQDIPEGEFITKTLQKDLIDYEKYIKEKIEKKRPIINKLIQNVQMTVNEITNDYIVNLYGSYGTGLCLPWSDIDIVLVCKGPNALIPTFLLNQICMGLKTKNWVQNIKIIESATIPIIKILTTVEYERMQIDISIQEDKHYGLKCVSLVKSYLSEYVVLEPLILALKTILKTQI